MKLLFLEPVLSETTPEQMEHIKKFLSDETELIWDKISYGPYTIQCEFDEAMALPAILEKCIEAEKKGFDGIFINCFGDPAVRAAREIIDIPVFGGFEPVIHTAMGLGDRIAVLNVLENVLPMNRGLVAKAHLDQRVVYMGTLGIPVDDLADEKTKDAVVKESFKAVKKHGAEVIVLGCTRMVGISREIEERLALEGCSIPVLESAAVGVTVLEMYAKMGLKHSKRTYMQVLGREEQ